MNALPMIFLLGLVTAFCSWLLCFPVVHFLRHRQVLDQPNERSSHVIPTPRGGGLAIIAVLIPGLLVLGFLTGERFPFLLTLGALLLGGISFVDDLRPLTPAIRFSIHLAAALILVIGLSVWIAAQPLIVFPSFLDLAIPGILLSALLCIYLVGYVNAFNFMDGINGLAACQALFSGIGTALLAFLLDAAEFRSISIAGALLAGAALGFLPHNFPRARVFMGDVGSVPIGFISAALGVVLAWKAGWWLLVPLGLLHTNFILDTSITLIRRILRGEKWYLPHREHFYQRLVRSGKSHPFVTGWEFLLQFVTLAAVVGYIFVPTNAGRAAISAGIITLWLAFFAWAECRFRASLRSSSTNLSSPVPGATPSS